MAVVRFLPGVNEGVVLQITIPTERPVTQWAIVLLYPIVNEGVALQIAFSAKRLVTLWTIVFDPTMLLLVTE